jgi:hypothetical protein
MRHVLLLACGLGLVFAAAGCKSSRHTASGCGCDSPPAHTVAASRPAPGGAVVPAGATRPAPAATGAPGATAAGPALPSAGNGQ